ncbi:hypothetical protein J6590_029425 [Homalodisca vitripennis]|nr:hypothetical protein J6590_029425 [Homalodisca vitripennis]
MTTLYIQEVVLYVDRENLSRLEDLHYYNTHNSTMYPLPTHHLPQYEKKTILSEQLSANANKNEERETAQVRTPKTDLTPGHLHAQRVLPTDQSWTLVLYSKRYKLPINLTAF